MRVHDGVLTDSQVLANFDLEKAAFGVSEIATDVSALMNGGTTIYSRKEFTVEPGVDYDALTLRTQYDDGFVAYLNGTEVARANAPDPVQWDSAAVTDRDDSLSRQFEAFDLSAHIGLLVDGTNVLAVHALESTVPDGAFLFNVELDAQQTSETAQLAVNEVTAGAPGVGEFWFEVANRGTRSVNLSGYQVKTESGQHTIAAGTLNPGEFLVLDAYLD